MKERVYEIARNREYFRCQRAPAGMVYKIFGKKTGLGASVNEQLAEELHKPVTTKFKRRKVYARFKDNISAADIAKMESLSSKNKNVREHYNKLMQEWLENNDILM